MRHVGRHAGGPDIELKGFSGRPSGTVFHETFRPRATEGIGASPDVRLSEEREASQVAGAAHGRGIESPCLEEFPVVRDGPADPREETPKALRLECLEPGPVHPLAPLQLS
jgi:hypothetical protein